MDFDRRVFFIGAFTQVLLGEALLASQASAAEASSGGQNEPARDNGSYYFQECWG